MAADYSWISGLAQLLPMLFGGGSTNGNMTGSSNTVANSTTSSSGVQQSMSDQDMELLRQLSAMLQGNSAQFSKENAMKDSEGLQAASLRGLREGALPGISAQEAQSGGYSSTSKKVLQNDAVNRASDSLTQLRLNAIMGYGNLQESNLQAAAAAIAALKGGKIITSENSSTNAVTNTTSSQNQTGGGGGLFGGLLGG